MQEEGCAECLPPKITGTTSDKPLTHHHMQSSNLRSSTTCIHQARSMILPQSCACLYTSPWRNPCKAISDTLEPQRPASPAFVHLIICFIHKGCPLLHRGHTHGRCSYIKIYYPHASMGLISHGRPHVSDTTQQGILINVVVQI